MDINMTLKDLLEVLDERIVEDSERLRNENEKH